MRKTVLLGFVTSVCILAGGCPLLPSDSDEAAIDVVIAITSTSGDAPLQVTVTAVGSTSKNGAIVKYHWDFAGEATSDNVSAMHTFANPGRYAIKLTVEDVAGEQAIGQIYVRVRGGPVEAVIKADKLSGAAPLTVQFDGTESTAEDDTIFDYYWDFGDTGTSRTAKPTHTFQGAGSYTVKLKAVSAGGVEGEAEATITVTGGAGGGSLQFNGTQYANLPVTVADALSAFTFEVWCNPDSSGGTIATFGAPNVSISVEPGTGVTIRSGSDTYYVSAAILAGSWQHLAVSFTDGQGANVYVDGMAAGTATLTGDFTVTAISLGAGYRGKLAGVTFWSTGRTATEVGTDMNGSISGSATGLVGAWPLSEGTGQTLTNNAEGGQDGTRGPSGSDEVTDPAWSNDGP